MMRARCLVLLLLCSSVAMAQTAVPWPDDLCQKGEAWACVESGTFLALTGRDAEAMDRFGRACAVDEVTGCDRMQELSAAGRGAAAYATVKERAKAACDKSQPRSCLTLGHLRALGGELDPARTLYTTACTTDPWTCTGLATLLGLVGGEADTPRAAELYAKACTAKNMRGCRELATLRNDSAAKQRVCDAGDAVTCYALGHHERACTRGVSESCVEQGRVLLAKGDVTAAARLFGLACGVGRIEACTDLGVLQLRANDLVNGIKTLEYACSAKEQRACVQLGAMLARAKRSDAEVARGVTLIRQACDAGDLDGCGQLGVALVQGVGGKPDPVAGAALVRKACDGGRAASCGDLGLVTLKGLGVKADAVAARALFDKACAAGHKESCAAAKATAPKPKKDFLTIEMERAAAAKALEAECDAKRDGAACFRAAMKLREELFAKNLDDQHRLLTKGCQLGHGPACADAEDVPSLERGCQEFSSGIACERLARKLEKSDPSRSDRMYLRGCDLDHGGACLNVAVRVRGRPDETLRLMRKACKLDDANGCEFLGDELRKHGQRDEARAAYGRACELRKKFDPACESVKKKIDKLGP